MKTRINLLRGLLFLALLFTLPRQAVPQDAAKGAEIKVQLHYSGSSTVDKKHKVFVALWDSPAFATSHVIPLAVESVSSKDGVATFSDVKINPAYVSAAFDPTGEWDGKSGPPPEGSILGMYSKTPGEPAPVTVSPGKAATVDLSFDDSVRMREGRMSR
jgi:hypothetical protein